MAAAAQRLIAEAVQPLAGNPQLREKLVDIRRSYEQVIDTASRDRVISGEFSVDAADRARTQVESWKQFIEDHKDEITALGVLYSQPYGGGLTYDDIKELVSAIGRPPHRWTPDVLWQAYEALDQSRVRGSGHRVHTDLVSLVRYGPRKRRRTGGLPRSGRRALSSLADPTEHGRHRLHRRAIRLSQSDQRPHCLQPSAST